MTKKAIPETHQSTLSDCRQSLSDNDRQPSLNVTILSPTCTRGRYIGRVSTSIRLRPTPMAPEDTMITLWPSLRNFTAVSTMRESVDRSGSWLLSSTIELVPAYGQLLFSRPRSSIRTEFDHHCQLFAVLHCCRFPQLATWLHIVKLP